jgi:hypothetical protein
MPYRCLQDSDSILSQLYPEELYIKYVEFISIGVITRKFYVMSDMELNYSKFNLQHHRYDNLKFRGWINFIFWHWIVVR